MTRGKDSIVFHLEWFETLRELGDNELRQMLTAIERYAKQRESPKFIGTRAALWNTFKIRIDYNNQRYEETCKRNRQNGLKGSAFGKLGGRPKKAETPENPGKPQETPNGVFKTPKTPDIDIDIDIDKETSLTRIKETPEAFSLETQNNKNYKKWNEEEFRADIARFPEYADIADEFWNYWTETDTRKKMRFQKERTWDTKRRLWRWRNNQTANQVAARLDCGSLGRPSKGMISAELARMEKLREKESAAF